MVYTIGFHGKSAEEFHQALKTHGVTRLVDVRCFPDSKSAGYARRKHLQTSLPELCQIDYVHLPLLAPTPKLLHGSFKLGISWEEYEGRYFEILRGRLVEEKLKLEFFQPEVCLMCAEESPDQCHRRLALEYLQSKWGADMTIEHL